MFYQPIGKSFEQALDALLRMPAAKDRTIKLIAPDPLSTLAAPVLERLEAMLANGIRSELVFTQVRPDELRGLAQTRPSLARGIAAGWVRCPAFRGANLLVTQAVIGDTLWIIERASGEPQAVRHESAVRAAHASFTLVATGSWSPMAVRKPSWLRRATSVILNERQKRVA